MRHIPEPSFSVDGFFRALLVTFAAVWLLERRTWIVHLLSVLASQVAHKLT